MNKLLVGGLAMGAVIGVFVACNGNDGVTGAAGAPGQNGTGAQGPGGANGTNGSNGTNGEAGAQIVVSALAKHGLAISPVAIDLTGKTGDQIEQIGQGSYLVNAVGDCGSCHSPGGPPPLKFLAGGTTFPLGPGAFVTARNLTPDPTTGLKLTEAQFIESFRTGKDFAIADEAGSPQALVVMPWQSYRWMSTADIQAMYAYLKAIPAQAGATPPDAKGAAVFPPTDFTGQYTDGQTDRALPPESDPQGAIPDPGNVLRGLAIDTVTNTAALAGLSTSEVGQYGRGAYLVNAIADCSGCHTNPERAGTGKINVAQFMTGGRIFATPAPDLQKSLKTVRVMSSNLLGPSGYFATADLPLFLATITQGVHAESPPPQAPLGFPMPARVFRNMTLDDLEAVYTYLHQVAIKVPGGRVDKVIRATATYCAADADCTATASPTCDLVNGECTAKTCGSDADCPACQTCTGSGNTKCETLHDVDGGAGALSACIAAGL